MVELRLDFPLAGGLHARPAAALRERALDLGAEATWTNTRNQRGASLRNVLELLATETRCGDPCVLRVDDRTAASALEAYLRGPFLAIDEPEPTAMLPAPGLPNYIQSCGDRWRKGLGLAPGFGEGPLRFLQEPGPEVSPDTPCQDPDRELRALGSALAELRQRLRSEAREARHSTQRGILEAHAALLEDEGWTGAMTQAVAREGLTARAAVRRATRAAMQVLEVSANPRVVERAQDLRGLADRLAVRLGDSSAETPRLAGPCVLAAEQLPPSLLLSLDHGLLRGLVLGEGGATSHTAILARAFGIPCVGGIPDLRALLQEGRTVLVDGQRGLVLLEPAPEVAARFRAAARLHERREAWLARGAASPAVSADGHPVVVLANISSAEEAPGAFQRGADGIGLFRSEMLFLDRATAPSEEEQTEVYARVLRAAGGRPVVLRLLDAGGDKLMPFLDLPAEPNPFLGLRGVRWYPRHSDLIRRQLRAALRAAPEGDLRLLVPMVSRPEEMTWVRALLDAEAADLRVAAPLPRLGMMVEVPAAALNLAAFDGLADFYCAGTNDLAQYLFAADRGDPGLCPPSRAWHPATLRVLDTAARAARAQGREFSLCGELAADPRGLPLLLGLGITRLSAASAALPALKAGIARLCLEACRSLVSEALAATGEAEVEGLLARFAATQPAPPLVDAELILLDADCASKSEAIRTLVEQLVLTGRAQDADGLEAAVLAREETYSTGIGHGLAVPHAKVEGLGAGGLAVLRLQQALDWGSADGQPVGTVLLLATDGGQDTHLKAFAQLARRLMDPGFRTTLAEAATKENVADLLRTALA